jgi:hypothetical protein
LQQSGLVRASKPNRNGWTTPLEVSVGDARDGALFFGYSSGQRQTLRMQKPPTLPAQTYLDASFAAQPNSDSASRAAAGGGGATRYAADVRRTLNEGDSWNLVVRTNASNEDVNIRWPSMGTLPRPYRLMLVDVGTGARRAMRTTTGYTFRSNSQGPTERLFRIEVSMNDNSALRLMDVRLSRVGGSYRVTYSLTKDADVSARMINAAGKVITSLPVTRTRSGLNSIVFEARDAMGRVPPRGVYLFELSAQTEEGEQVRGIKSVAVR